MHGRSRLATDLRIPTLAGPSWGGVYSLSCMTVVVWPYTLASLKCRDRARRQIFTDQADIADTKLEAP